MIVVRLDDPLTRHVFLPLAMMVSKVSIQCGISANFLTLFFILVGLIGAACYTSSPLFSAGCLALMWTMDLADGMVARRTGNVSRIGLYLDTIGHFVVGVALGCAIGEDIWGRLMVSIALTLAPAIYALQYSGHEYGMFTRLLDLRNGEVPYLFRIIAKIFICPAENPGISYLVALTSIVWIKSIILEVLMISLFGTILMFGFVVLAKFRGMDAF